MKNFQLTLISAFLGAIIFPFIFRSSNLVGQNAPVASFIYSVGLNGAVSFTSTSTNTVASMIHTWKFGDGSSASNVQSTTHSYSASGNYAVQLILSNSLGIIYDSTTKVIAINNVTTSIANQTKSYYKEGKVFPNPSNTALQLDLDSPELVISIINLIDLLGREYQVKFSQTGSKVDINVSELYPGKYILRAQIFGTSLYYQKAVLITAPQ